MTTAAALPRQRGQAAFVKCDDGDLLVEMNLEMYQITVAEHPEYTIPFLAFRGVPIGIDVNKLMATGITPVMDVGVAGRAGGQIGAGVMRAPIACFVEAAQLTN